MIILSIIAYTPDTRSMDSSTKIESVDILKIGKKENKKEIWYRAELFALDGSTAMVGHQYKIDTKTYKAGDIICWKECGLGEPKLISSEHFALLEEEYARRKKKNT